MNEPRPFDMSKKEDRERWFREMEDYLKKCNGLTFVNAGTDFKGREFALEGFQQLKDISLKRKSSEKETDLNKIINEHKAKSIDDLPRFVESYNRALIIALKEAFEEGKMEGIEIGKKETPNCCWNLEFQEKIRVIERLKIMKIIERGKQYYLQTHVKDQEHIGCVIEIFDKIINEVDKK